VGGLKNCAGDKPSREMRTHCVSQKKKTKEKRVEDGVRKMNCSRGGKLWGEEWDGHGGRRSDQGYCVKPRGKRNL